MNPWKRHPLPCSQHEGCPCALTGQRESEGRGAQSTGSGGQPGVEHLSSILTRPCLSGLQRSSPSNVCSAQVSTSGKPFHKRSCVPPLRAREPSVPRRRPWRWVTRVRTVLKEPRRTRPRLARAPCGGPTSCSQPNPPATAARPLLGAVFARSSSPTGKSLGPRGGLCWKAPHPTVPDLISRTHQESVHLKAAAGNCQLRPQDHY